MMRCMYTIASLNCISFTSDCLTKAVVVSMSSPTSDMPPLQRPLLLSSSSTDEIVRLRASITRSSQSQQQSGNNNSNSNGDGSSGAAAAIISVNDSTLQPNYNDVKARAAYTRSIVFHLTSNIYVRWLIMNNGMMYRAELEPWEHPGWSTQSTINIIKKTKSVTNNKDNNDNNHTNDHSHGHSNNGNVSDKSSPSRSSITTSAGGHVSHAIRLGELASTAISGNDVTSR
jgi:hypothetical protein